MKRILLITGASSDVGMSLLRKIAADYDVIYMQYRTMSDSLRELTDSIAGEVVLIQADLTRDEEIEKITEQMAQRGEWPTHFVHLPAPKAYNKHFHKDFVDNFDLGWRVCVRSAVILLQKMLPQMSRNHYGRILIMLTAYTIGEPPKFQSSYVTVKYALLGLIRSLAVEYEEKGITVNGISPEMIETKFLSEIPELIVEQNAARQKNGRNLTPVEVAEAMIPLLEDENSVNGGNLEIRA